MTEYYEEFKGKTAVITGAAQGIGLGLSRGFAQIGANVVMADLNEEKVCKEADNISEEGKTVGVGTNVTDASSVKTLVEKTIAFFGCADILVNNAGVLKSHFIGEFPEDEWDLVLDVNLKGTFLCTREFAVLFAEQKEGVIININSKSGKKGGLWNAAYCASKFGVLGLTQSAALDLAQYNVRVNAVCPGNVMSTPLWDKLDKMYAKKLNKTPEEVRRIYRDKVPLGRNTQVEDVLNAVLFLASQRSSFITGEAMNVSGGQEMR